MSCSKAMRGCRLGCLHRRMVQEYRAARHADELAAEAATALYPAEYAAYVAERPLITFQAWLQGHQRVAA